VIEPTERQVLDFCARDPVERVFLEDVARRGLGRFGAIAAADGSLEALCHVGANLVPSGEGCERFAELAGFGQSRMIIGETRAVSAVWDAARELLPEPREDRPGQPATPDDVERLLPACAAAHELELGINPLVRDPDGFRWRTLAQVEEGRSWIWLEDDVVLFKAESSAWTPNVVQVSQVWTDPEARGRGYAKRGMRDLCRLLLRTTPTVTLFVRADNAPAIALYDAIGMRRVLEYRSVLF
jgi:RimJ/RimL family protein N-acetyltransferase